MADKKKMNDLRTKSLEDLQKHAIELKREMLNLRFQKASGELEKTHRFKQARREVARIKTFMAEHANKLMER